MKNRVQKFSVLLWLIIFFQTFNQLTAQVGTGYNYSPSYVKVTGGGDMPDIANGYTCNCDGTGATDAAPCLQAAMDSAASQHKPLLIPYTSGYYKIESTLNVNCSVMGIGGMPTIKQTSDVVVLSLNNNMTGWIYNLHCIGTYGAPDQPTEHAHIIDIGGVNGVTISDNILEKAMGDIISDNAQGGGTDTARNVLITNNTLKSCMRTVFSLYWISNRWAIMNNLLSYNTGWANVIEIEPLEAKCFVTNIEIGYNNIQSPGAQSNYYSNIMDVTNYNDKTPGGGVVGHHNWGKWGVPFGSSSGYSPATVFTKNVQGNTPPAGSDTLAPSIPAGLVAAVADSSFILTWEPSTDNVAVTGYEVFKDGFSVGKTMETSKRINGLSCSMAYSMTVKARDAEMNWSEASTALIVNTPYCIGSDTFITFEDRPAIETGLNGNYAGINWGLSGWVTYNETGLSQASKVLKLNSGETTQQTDTLIYLSGKTLKSLDVAAIGTPGVNEIILSSTGNPDVTLSDMISTFANYKTNWKIVTDTIIIKITCNAGASSVIMDNLAFGDAQPPTVPAFLASSLITYTSATLSWTASTDNIAVSEYEVFKDNVSIGTTSAISMDISGLTCSTEYFFTVKSKDISENWSDLSVPFSITTSDCDVIAPGIPDGLKEGNVTTSSFVLSWNPSSDNDGIAGYDVFKDGIKFGTTTTDTSINISGLVQNTSYAMTVKAKDPSGNVSDASAPLIVTTVQCELPAEWKSADIGVTSGQSACESNGVFTITGSGADIWASADEFRYAYKSIDGDGVIIAKVESIQNTDPWAKSGVMFREDLTAGSKYIDCILTSANGIGFQSRSATNGTCTAIAAGAGISAPYWVKLERIGNAFNAYTSADGIAWTQFGKSTTLMMSTKLFMGLAVTAHSAGKSCVSVLSDITTEGLMTDISETGSRINSDVLVYPNPVSENLTISNIPVNAEISIFTMNGKLERKIKHVNKSALNIDVSSWNKGVYLVKVQAENSVSVKKVVIE